MKNTPDYPSSEESVLVWEFFVVLIKLISKSKK